VAGDGSSVTFNKNGEGTALSGCNGMSAVVVGASETTNKIIASVRCSIGE